MPKENQITNSVNVPGVSFNKKKQKWIATFTFKKKQYKSKYHDRFIWAVMARARFEDKYGNYLDGTYGQAQQYVKLKDNHQGLLKAFIKDKCDQRYCEDEEHQTPKKIVYRHFRLYCRDKFKMPHKNILTEKQFIDFVPLVFCLELNKFGDCRYLCIRFRG